MKSQLPSNTMTKRDLTWDYRQPAIYMLTLTIAERRPLLGELVVPEQEGTPCPERAYVVYSEWGKQVIDCLKGMPERHPELQILQYQLMPDHLHIALRVTRQMQQPLGTLINIFKHLTEKLPASPCPVSLWDPGFNDNRLRNKGQLQRMYDYIHDNPRRLALKRLNRELLRIRRGERYAGLSIDAVGNMELLQREKKAVHVRSRWTAEEKRAYKNGCILAARQGAVLVGPFISPDERAVLEVALREKLPVVYLQENGFPELYKPAGELIDSCAEGHLLLIAPWPYHSRRQTITREQCQLLNTMAERIAAYS